MSSGNFFDRIGHGVSREFKRANSEFGRWSNSIEDKMPNWMPDSWKHYFATRLNPATQMTTPAVGDYYAARQRGEDRTDARQSAGSALGRDAAIAAAIIGGVYGAGAYGGGAAGGSAGGGAGGSAGGMNGLNFSLGGESFAGPQAGAGAGGMDWMKMAQKGLGGMMQGQQQGQASAPQTDTSLLAYLLANQDNQPAPPQPMWTSLQR